MIFQVAYEIVMPGLNELLEKSLPRDAEDDILRLVSVDPLVQDPHNLRTRRLGGGIVAQIHIRVPGEMSVAESHEITRHIEDRMHEKFGELAHIIVHTEPAN